MGWAVVGAVGSVVVGEVVVVVVDVVVGRERWRRCLRRRRCGGIGIVVVGGVGGRGADLLWRGAVLSLPFWRCE